MQRAGWFAAWMVRDDDDDQDNHEEGYWYEHIYDHSFDAGGTAIKSANLSPVGKSFRDESIVNNGCTY